MNRRCVIYIPESAEDIPVKYFPVSNSLQRFFRKEEVKLVGDLRQLLPDTVEQILYNKKKPFCELKQLLFSIQDNDSDEIITIQEDVINHIEEDDPNLNEEFEEEGIEAEPITTLNHLIEFINDFVTELKGDDKEIFFGRFGGFPDEQIVPIVKICGRYKLSPDFVAQSLTAIINEIKTCIGQDRNKILDELYDNCLESICPLTPQFLVYLTNNDYNLFLYPPAFYVRILGKLSPEIPILPEYQNKAKKLEKEALKLSNQIKKFLIKNYVPASLTEVFNQVMIANAENKRLAKTFFEAIRSVKFSLIITDNPESVYIELYEKV